MASDNAHDDGTAYLLAELTNSRELMAYYAQQSDKRVDVLLVILTAVVAGMALLSQAKLNLQTYWGALAIASLGMTVLAVYTTFFVLACDGHIVDRGHTIQRIRMHFVGRHPDLRDTVLTPLIRADGSVLGLYGNWRIPMLICALSCGSFVTALVLFVGDFGSPNIVVLVCGFLVMLWSWIALELWFRRRYNALEEALNTTKLGDSDTFARELSAADDQE